MDKKILLLDINDTLDGGPNNETDWQKHCEYHDGMKLIHYYYQKSKK